jgi:hypothetical protein
MTIKHYTLLLALVCAPLDAAELSRDGLIGSWRLLGLTETADAAPGDGPEVIFEFRDDGTVHSSMAENPDNYRLEDQTIVVVSKLGSQAFEVQDYDGTHMKWKLEVGEVQMFYHLERAAAD